MNVIVAGKQPEFQWLDIDAATKHCAEGLGIWEWACTHSGKEPDLIMACAGDVPTVETLAAVTILRDAFPDLKIRVVNVVDLMCLQTQDEHPHGYHDEKFDAIFTKDKPIIFAFHGYPTIIHRLTYKRKNQAFHVHGYKEEGTTTTPFDMCVLNGIDRFHLADNAIRRLPHLGKKAESFRQTLQEKLEQHTQYVRKYGQDMPEVRDWKWS